MRVDCSVLESVPLVRCPSESFCRRERGPSACDWEFPKENSRSASEDRRRWHLTNHLNLIEQC